MSDENREEGGEADEARRLWQEQTVEAVEVSLAAVRARAAELDQTVRRRDRREYAAGLVVALAAIAGMLMPGGPMYQRVAGLVTLVGTASVLWHLARHARGEPAPPDAGAATSEHVAFLRARLSRQRALLASAWRWYVGPLLPGPVVLFVGVAMALPPARREGPALWVGLGITLAIVMLVFAGVAWLNVHAARRLEEEIRALGP